MPSRFQGDGQSDSQDLRFSIRRNHRIRSAEVRVISHEGKPLGVMRTSDAVNRAIALNLDLVELDPNACPPVCRIMDFEKYLRNRKHKPPNRWSSGEN